MFSAPWTAALISPALTPVCPSTPVPSPTRTRTRTSNLLDLPSELLLHIFTYLGTSTPLESFLCTSLSLLKVANDLSLHTQPLRFKQDKDKFVHFHPFSCHFGISLPLTATPSILSELSHIVELSSYITHLELTLADALSRLMVAIQHHQAKFPRLTSLTLVIGSACIRADPMVALAPILQACPKLKKLDLTMDAVPAGFWKGVYEPLNRTKSMLAGLEVGFMTRTETAARRMDTLVESFASDLVSFRLNTVSSRFANIIFLKVQSLPRLRVLDLAALSSFNSARLGIDDKYLVPTLTHLTLKYITLPMGIRDLLVALLRLVHLELKDVVFGEDRPERVWMALCPHASLEFVSLESCHVPGTSLSWLKEVMAAPRLKHVQLGSLVFNWRQALSPEVGRLDGRVFSKPIDETSLHSLHGLHMSIPAWCLPVTWPALRTLQVWFGSDQTGSSDRDSLLQIVEQAPLLEDLAIRFMGTALRDPPDVDFMYELLTLAPSLHTVSFSPEPPQWLADQMIAWCGDGTEKPAGLAGDGCDIVEVVKSKSGAFELAKWEEEVVVDEDLELEDYDDVEEDDHVEEDEADYTEGSDAADIDDEADEAYSADDSDQALETNGARLAAKKPASRPRLIHLQGSLSRHAPIWSSHAHPRNPATRLYLSVTLDPGHLSIGLLDSYTCPTIDTPLLSLDSHLLDYLLLEKRSKEVQLAMSACDKHYFIYGRLMR